jgi:hypothetical protein
MSPFLAVGDGLLIVLYNGRGDPGGHSITKEQKVGSLRASVS